MRKILFLISIFAFCATPSLCQIYEKYIDYDKYGVGKMPFNEDGEVVFEKVVSCDSVTKSQIYSASKLFFERTCKIISDDQNNFIILSNGIAKAPIPNGFSVSGGFFDSAELHYKVRVQCRDNRYKVTIYSITGKIPARVVSGIYVKEISINADELTDEKSLDENGKLKKEGMFWRMSIIDAQPLLTEYIELGIKEEIDKIFNEDW